MYLIHMYYLLNPVFISIAYAGQDAVKKSKGMPLHIIIPFIIALIPVFIILLVWLSPRLEKKYGQNKTEDNRQ